MYLSIVLTFSCVFYRSRLSPRNIENGLWKHRSPSCGTGGGKVQRGNKILPLSKSVVWRGGTEFMAGPFIDL